MQAGVWTIPNLITTMRLVGIPIFVWILFGIQNRLAAALLLAGLGATDWVDGYLARKLKQESTFGRILDPSVDRLLILVAIPSLLVDESVPIVFGLVSLVRECLVTLAVLALLAIKIDAVKVNWYGKVGTFALLTAFPLFLLSKASVPSGLADVSQLLAWISGVPGLILSYYAVIQYIPAVRSQLKERHSP